MIQISDGEGTSLKDFIEYHFLDSIRNDPEIDSLLYIWNILNVYKKLGGLKEFSDYEPDTE